MSVQKLNEALLLHAECMVVPRDRARQKRNQNALKHGVIPRKRFGDAPRCGSLFEKLKSCSRELKLAASVVVLRPMCDGEHRRN